MAALLGGAAAVVLGTLASRGSSSPSTVAVTTVARPVVQRKPSTKAPVLRSGRPVKLAGLAAFDPKGDRAENDDLAPEATDGDAATSWRSEHYTSFFKPGVGLVLDAGRRVRIGRLVVRTDTPGFTAQIQSGNSPGGPFIAVSGAKPVKRTTAFTLRKAGPARYVVIWITDMPDDFAAHVSEVTATSLR